MNETQCKALQAFWLDWCRDNFIAPMSADEIPLHGHGLTDRQAAVVSAFSALWEAADDCGRNR